MVRSCAIHRRVFPLPEILPAGIGPIFRLPRLWPPMAFNSLQYALLLAVVVSLYRLLPHRSQNILLLLASYLFYGFWDWRFLSLLWISTLTDFLVGRAMGATTDVQARRRLLWVSMIVNLGILGFFKYFNFFVDSLAELVDVVGWSVDVMTLTIILPVGISFYTFQTMSYTIDVYRREMEPTENLLSFAVFVAYFPQLVAGPIERAQRLLPQFESRRSPVDRNQIASGLTLILIGLFKKVVIADALAPLVQSTFAESGTAGWVELLAGVYAFSLQIYGDFSGYSSIARGSSRLLGIELMVNFNQPYLSRNISAFWRTWHISLSTWLRDYVYIPLGGNRGTGVATLRNLMITMLLGGLWHGASWTFVVWGGLHGCYLAGHRLVRHRAPSAGTEVPRWRDVPAMAATFHLVALSWIFFRADSFSQAADYVGGIISLRDGGIPFVNGTLLALCFFAVLVLDLSQRIGRQHEAILAWPAVARGVGLAAMGAGIVMFSGQPTVPFLYFQF